jgi:hypothetical protein
MASRPE